MLGDMRKQIAAPKARLAALAELPGRFHHAADVVELRRLDAKDAVRVLPVVAGEKRLVVKCVNLRRPAVHVQKNDVANLRRVMQFAQAGAVSERRVRIRIVGKQRGKSDGAKSAAAAPEHFAPRQTRRVSEGSP